MVALFGVCLACALTGTSSGDDSAVKVLPVPACAEGWIMEGEAALYDKDTLFERINGESELFFPYGFEVLVSARYASRQNPSVAVEADVYRMGSLLDAFGIYSNYRGADASPVKVGGEGFASSSQLLFYQDRYFVRLQASGALSVDEAVLLACARAVSRNLPSATRGPRELEAFSIPGVVRGSERYIAQSLLGYAFFRRGFIADAILDDEDIRIFVVTEESREAGRTAFDLYNAYLKASGRDVEVSEKGGIISLSGVDPLYRGVVVKQVGRFLIGAVKVKEVGKARQLVEEMRRRLQNDPGSLEAK